MLWAACLDKATKSVHRTAPAVQQGHLMSKTRIPAKGKSTVAKSARNAGGKTKADAASNPLLQPWKTPFEMPPFGRVRAEHFMPAIDKGFQDNVKEMAAIASNTAAPTFK